MLQFQYKCETLGLWTLDKRQWVESQTIEQMVVRHQLGNFGKKAIGMCKRLDMVACTIFLKVSDRKIFRLIDLTTFPSYNRQLLGKWFLLTSRESGTFSHVLFKMLNNVVSTWSTFSNCTILQTVLSNIIF